ncbi:hypothetical protein ORJ66_16025 [Pseudoalteromonas tunicata]|uniref:hypothetical protein n=1 Tax=Pseudoalteromonas tunicata TaxID=314281 RepID=UPI00273F7076|nr:hypothetical protein [Pseudoalteromonas tunicata]MDP5214561.1 hypothetical protein [Pseudoalteromonas tunicata]
MNNARQEVKQAMLRQGLPLHGGYVQIKCIFEDQFAYFLKIWGAEGFQGEIGDSLPLAAVASATTMLI